MPKELTYEQIRDYINGENGNGCELITTKKEFYINKKIENKRPTQVKLLIKCNCKNDFINTFNSFKFNNKKECDICSGYRCNYKNIKYFIEVESDSGCKLLSSEYINNTTQMKIQCKCGNEFNATWVEFKEKNKRRCHECNFWTINKIKEWIKDNIEGYECLNDKYIPTEKLLFRCDKGHDFKSKWNNFYSHNNRCPICANEDRKHDYKKIKKDIESINGYKLLSNEYIGCDEKLEIQCPKGHEFEMSYYIFNNVGCRCPVCMSNKLRLKFQTPIEDIYNYIKKEEYEFIEWVDEYQNAKSKFKIKCPKGHDFITHYDRFKQGSRCPVCAESKGEQIIRHYCEDNNVYYNPQYTFDNLVSDLGNLLRFDFAIFENEKKTKLKYLIEYDGIFHYEKQYDDDNFETLKFHDQLKNNYCMKNNIPLLRIPYWEYENIEEILKDVIVNNNLNNKFFIHN